MTLVLQLFQDTWHTVWWNIDADKKLHTVQSTLWPVTGVSPSVILNKCAGENYSYFAARTGWSVRTIQVVIVRDLRPYSPSRRMSPNLVKSRSREFECYNDFIAMNYDRHLGSNAAEVPVKCLSDWKSLNPNLAASRSCGKTSIR